MFTPAYRAFVGSAGARAHMEQAFRGVEAIVNGVKPAVTGEASYRAAVQARNTKVAAKNAPRAAAGPDIPFDKPRGP